MKLQKEDVIHTCILYLENLIFYEISTMLENEKTQNQYEMKLPQSIIESFVRFLVPEIRKYYSSEQGQKEFTQWQQEQENKKQA